MTFEIIYIFYLINVVLKVPILATLKLSLAITDKLIWKTIRRGKNKIPEDYVKPFSCAGTDVIACETMGKKFCPLEGLDYILGLL